MTFTSLSFWIFLAVVYAAYRTLSHERQNLLLLGASYLFYGWWDLRFLLLLMISTALYYASGALIHRGALEARERLAASGGVLAAALLASLSGWRGAECGSASALVCWDWLFQWRPGWRVFLAAVTGVGIANALYPWLATRPPATKKRLALWLGVGGNLAILGVLKYYGFFLENVGFALRSIAIDPERLRLDLVLPVGISFYTFQGMTYVIDIHRGRLAPAARFRDLALFVAFFPTILSGPIERASRLLPQLVRPRVVRPGSLGAGLYLIIQGLFKKVVVADGLARTVSYVYGATGKLSWIDAVVGTLAFAVQLYADFSGYSEMALGVASLFGIEVTTNFRFPFFARDPADFWGRWHISLSSWFRDYVFFPLGGPRGSAGRWIRNVLLTFLVTGLWHGASWHYVLWGLYHGVLLCGQRLLEGPPGAGRAGAKGGVPVILKMLFCFTLTTYGWVLFRASSFAQIRALTSALILDVGNLHLTAPSPGPPALVGLAVFFFNEVLTYRRGGKQLREFLPRPAWTAVFAVMLFALALGSGSVSTQFVYFVF